MDPEIKRYIFRVPSLPLKLIKIGTSEMVQVLSEKSDDLSSISYILMVEVENQSWQVLLGPPQAYGEKGVYAHSCTHTEREIYFKTQKGYKLRMIRQKENAKANKTYVSLKQKPLWG